MKPLFGKRSNSTQIPRTGNHFARQSEKLFIIIAAFALVAAIGFGSVAYATNFFTTPLRGQPQTDPIHIAGQEDVINAAAAVPAAENVQSGFIATEQQKGDEAFALWSRGRMAVTSVDGKNLLFEANPLLARVGVWGSFGVDGNMTVLGSAEMGSLSASGNVDIARSATIKGSLQASELTAEKASVSTLASTSLQSEEATATKLTASNLDVQTSKIASLEVQKTTGGSANFETLDADSLASRTAELVALTADTMTAKTISAAILSVPDIQTDNLDAQSSKIASLDVQKTTGGSANFETLDADSLASKTAELVALTADNVTANTVSASSLSVPALQTATIEVEALIGKALSGVLQEVEVARQSCGVVTFPAIDASGIDFVSTLTIEVPAETTAVFTQSEIGDGDWICAFEVEQIDESHWNIVRRFPKPAIDEMTDGVFAPTSEIQVHWLAIRAH